MPRLDYGIKVSSNSPYALTMDFLINIFVVSIGVCSLGNPNNPNLSCRRIADVWMFCMVKTMFASFLLKDGQGISVFKIFFNQMRNTRYIVSIELLIISLFFCGHSELHQEPTRS